MHFKHPEVLYFLFLLIVPVLVHLFHLQKFKKTPFTNVAFLKLIKQQSRKSSQLKKWLVLATRLLSIFAIVFVFSQPYIGNKQEQTQKHTFIYLDNSLSMSGKGKKGNLLQNAVNGLIKQVNNNSIYSLQTNNFFLENLSSETLIEKLKNIKYTAKKKNFETINLQVSSLLKEHTKTINSVFYISDFQNTRTENFANIDNKINAIQLLNNEPDNLSIDSVYINNEFTENTSINIVVNNQGEAKKNIPIAIYNKAILKNKQVFSVGKNSTQTIQFKFQDLVNFEGKVTIKFNDTFNFDNTFYFAVSKPKKNAILSIGKTSNFLKKIYTEEEFLLQQKQLNALDYNLITKQQFIILNELKSIPKSLQNSILNFIKSGGDVAIIPHKIIDKNSYNSLLNKIGFGSITTQKKDTLLLTKINFEHDFLKNVFLKKIKNFQYPFVLNSFTTSFNTASVILSLENKTPFLSVKSKKNGKVYLFSGSLKKDNTNFTKSPLIVPVFYNMAKLSFKQKKIFYRTGKENSFDINFMLQKNSVLQITNNKISLIPQQKTYTNKVKITTDLIEDNGFFKIKNNNKNIITIAYNNPKEESNLSFLDSSTMLNNEFIKFSDSVTQSFSDVYSKNKVQWLWKWFLTLAIVSLLLEIFILKFFEI